MELCDKNIPKSLFTLVCEKWEGLSLCVFSVVVSRSSWPSGIHNKASCSTLRGSGRGRTMATIWALWGPALWSGAAELGSFEQWVEMWAPQRAPGPCSSSKSQERAILYETITRFPWASCSQQINLCNSPENCVWDKDCLPNVVCPQRYLQLPQDFGRFLNPSAELLGTKCKQCYCTLSRVYYLDGRIVWVVTRSEVWKRYLYIPTFLVTPGSK